jgi:hypothetical protein
MSLGLPDARVNGPDVSADLALDATQGPAAPAMNCNTKEIA